MTEDDEDEDDVEEEGQGLGANGPESPFLPVVARVTGGFPSLQPRLSAVNLQGRRCRSCGHGGFDGMKILGARTIHGNGPWGAAGRGAKPGDETLLEICTCGSGGG